jgi:kinesin family member 11
MSLRSDAQMLQGFNCTIFAYGQTGTGKTYTMSGDMNDTMGLLSDAAGIIPRVLQALFNKLEMDDTESNVRCSFIELYNEELRDLLSEDEGAKLKIFDDNSRKGHATTVVQGMEERHIMNAAEGIKRLQEGSVRRQVAATKCNDLSSRGHTVFTITVHIKKAGENGEAEFFSAGKLNLVDLAGSENIQRSGAENKRATEAGLINKSLLTLGRVINALVDRSQHIPYRESKLTRLLQDSLGGRTKTCIIATISPAKSNLEETISTLDYAFRAKNIRNKPQMNGLINKKTLLREFSAEIEKLRSELIVTRQRNGVYLSNDAYEELTAQAESRRILVDEQSAKIETLETNLRNKLQELFSLTSNFMGIKKDNENVRQQLDETKDVLDQTELVLAATRKTLAEEAHLRKAHQKTENELRTVGGELISILNKTVGDVNGLRAKSKRKSDLQTLNRSTWEMSQDQVSNVTELVESRVQEFRQGQQGQIASISGRLQAFMKDELDKLAATQDFLDENLLNFAESKDMFVEKTKESKEAMDEVLEEIKLVRDNIKRRVGDSLQAIASTAEKIATDVLTELTTFHDQLHASYSLLGREFRSLFEDLLRQLSLQRSESETLRQQLKGASDALLESNAGVSQRIEQIISEEREQAASERQQLLQQIAGLITLQAEVQQERWAAKSASLRTGIDDASRMYEKDVKGYSVGMDAWNDKSARLLEDAGTSQDMIRTKLTEDWAVSAATMLVKKSMLANLLQTANDHSNSIQGTTKSVYAETVKVVDEQLNDLDVQMRDLDDFVTRARSQNSKHHQQHGSTLSKLSSTVEQSFSNISNHFGETYGRVKDLGTDVEAATDEISASLEPLDDNICQPLANLREEISHTALQEYQPTGETPERTQYQYPTHLPRTETHDTLLGNMRSAQTPSKIPIPQSIYSDGDLSERAKSPLRPTSSSGALQDRAPLSMSQRDPNTTANSTNNNLTSGNLLFDPAANTMTLPLNAAGENTVPLFKRSVPAGRSTNAVSGGIGGMGKPARRAGQLGEGRENVPPSAFAQSLPRRKSPRLH